MAKRKISELSSRKRSLRKTQQTHEKHEHSKEEWSIPEKAERTEPSGEGPGGQKTRWLPPPGKPPRNTGRDRTCMTRSSQERKRH